MNVDDSVLSKKQNYRLWRSGAFGNKLRAWCPVEEWRASGFEGRVVLRTLLGNGGKGLCQYQLLPDEVEPVVASWLGKGVPIGAIMVNESAPDGAMVLQGEYLNDVYVLDGEVRWGYFLHSFVKAQMRDALNEKSEVAQGLVADLLLRRAMTPSSYDDWRLLLDRYPGHVFEVSVYGHCLGDVPGRNALVWEVRRY